MFAPFARPQLAEHPGVDAVHPAGNRLQHSAAAGDQCALLLDPRHVRQGIASPRRGETRTDRPRRRTEPTRPSCGRSSRKPNIPRRDRPPTWSKSIRDSRRSSVRAPSLSSSVVTQGYCRVGQARQFLSCLISRQHDRKCHRVELRQGAVRTRSSSPAASSRRSSHWQAPGRRNRSTICRGYWPN